jgi:four helix bundle protein
MVIRNYTDLTAWQKAMTLSVSVYRATASMPREELYGLTSQMRRSSVSIPSNIAEGQGRRTDGEFLNCLSVAYGSLRELETQVMLASRLEYLDENLQNELLAECAEVGRLLNGLMKTVGAS